MAAEPIQSDLCGKPWCQALRYMLGHGKIVISLHTVDNKVVGYRVDWHEKKVGGVTQTATNALLGDAMNEVLIKVFPPTSGPAWKELS